MNSKFSITVLGSGSRGNASILQFDETTVLLDSGFTMKEIVRRMKLQGFSPEQLDAIVVTHYHSDHIHSAHMLNRKYKIPVYCTEETFPVINKKSKRLLNIHIFRESFWIKQLKFIPIPVDHDAEGTVAFHISNSHSSITVATDLGTFTPALEPYLVRSQVWLLESNHDSHLLKNGSYPMDLKFRIASKFGHLSNDQAMDIVEQFMTDETHTLVLGHLSQENNSPGIVLDAVEKRVGNKMENRKLFVATQNTPLPTIFI